MPILDLFSIPVELKIKTRLFAISTSVVYLLMTVAIVLPVIIAYNAGGFWLKNRMYLETPRIRFTYKYLLLAERDLYAAPIVCSTFSTYQGISIKDDCITVKVREGDVNKDLIRDVLKFETKFWSDQAIRSVKLLLWFEFQLKDIIQHKAETLVAFDATLPQDCQQLSIVGNLKLNQKGVIRRDNFPEIPNNKTVELTEYSLDEVLSHYAKKTFSAELMNIKMMRQTGFADDMPITISAEIFYREQLLYYQPAIWEEIKWAWIQYLSILFVTLYFIKRILRSLFLRGRLRSYIITPWKKEI
ncbi:transmembrane protein 231 [Diachasma alloeum]|uniref:transmembrane protein 231 n=1 Tax=Diachasma alloeum TaxID=454923 RepID=UPI00073840B6|nr:transmembrane protein 231 [Diachasma alloeum]